MNRNCSICLDSLQNGRDWIRFLRCGHSMHGLCFSDYISKGKFACPVCRRSICNPKEFEKFFDDEIAATQMPPDYRNKQMTVFCNDC